MTISRGPKRSVYTPTEASDRLKFYVRYCCVTLIEQDVADEQLYSGNIVDGGLARRMIN